MNSMLTIIQIYVNNLSVAHLSSRKARLAGKAFESGKSGAGQSAVEGILGQVSLLHFAPELLELILIDKDT